MSLWDYRYDGLPCPSGCTGLTLPVGSVAECPDDYRLIISEIRDVFLSGVTVNGGTGKVEAANKPSDWTSEDGYSGLTHLIGFGDKPKAESETLPLPGFENRVIDRNHSMNFDSTDAKQANIDLIRQMQCGKQVAIWWWTHDGMAVGGADGIVCQVDPGMVFGRGKTPLTGNIVFTWSNKFDPEMQLLAEAPIPLMFNGGPQNLKAPPPPPMSKKGKKAA